MRPPGDQWAAVVEHGGDAFLVGSTAADGWLVGACYLGIVRGATAVPAADPQRYRRPLGEGIDYPDHAAAVQALGDRALGVLGRVAPDARRALVLSRALSEASPRLLAACLDGWVLLVGCHGERVAAIVAGYVAWPTAAGAHVALGAPDGARQIAATDAGSFGSRDAAIEALSREALAAASRLYRARLAAPDVRS